ncbi:class I SAM-dependent DNA methyltransferase [Chthonomonas calidirosea]|uniref:class I SAM-dependent DNA methyltransferase n=1 Tax=Chthonomonas calidirosea TaxID=454171 RepID=UPI0006EC5D01|nr:class I SAM-dependent methyltransferase [Chthonomonas calidirosea]CEK19989.1 methylase involved in ubiquinone/menaquinone biosynthesis [Chthonomonas calidirosea]
MSEQSAFQPLAPLYDTLMQGVPYEEWARYLQRLLQERQAHPKRALDLACGTGNVAEQLHAMGMEVVGVDISPAMIEEAKRKAAQRQLPIRYYVQDAAELDLPEAPFELCVSLFDSLNYIIEPKRLAQAFQRVANHLAAGGLFIFDLNTEYALENRFFDQNNLGSDEPLLYDWRSTYFPEKRLCRVDMHFIWRAPDGSQKVFEEVHWQYAYREQEVRAFLTQAGFDQIAVYHAYTLRPPAPYSDRLFYVARRPATSKPSRE